MSTPRQPLLPPRPVGTPQGGRPGTPRRRIAPRWWAAALAFAPAAAALALGGGCGEDAPSPFTFDAGFNPTGTGGGSFDAGPDADPTLGGPCVDDGQCNDEIECTSDRCDLEVDRCRFTPDNGPCQNDFYCDGEEVCDNKLGCRAGEPESCSDMNVCTIDTCIEATHLCEHVARDADQDGDPDGHCPQGDDCDDTDPTVSSLVPEVCGNLKDDDCDGAIDEAGCTSPLHDTCLDPLEISTSGSYQMDTTAAAFHYASSCGLPNQPTLRDVVAAILIPAGPPVDIEVTARTTAAEVSVTLAGQCGDAATEIACGGPFISPQGGKIAKLRGRSLGSPDEPLALPLYVSTAPGSQVIVDVQYLPPEPVPTNETCGTADPITPGVPVTATILEAAKDLGSVCQSATGDLVWTFDLAAPQNVDVFAASIDGDGLPTISLRGPGCALPEDEITCQTSLNPHLFWQSLDPGTYYVAVSASSPTQASIVVELSPPTLPPLDDACTTTQVLTPNVTLDVPLEGHQDDHHLGCFPGAPDAAYVLELTEPSDVLLVERTSAGDAGAIELALPACNDATDLLACGFGAPSPVRAADYNVPAGEYRVIAESIQGSPVQITAFVRPATAPTLVPFADGCADVYEIPPTGGFFQGNTSNASAD
jgi:Putative metal-binding motif